MKKTLAVIAAVGLLRVGAASQAGPGAPFEAFWAAGNTKDAAAAATAVAGSGVTFEQALAQLKRGRAYSKDAPRGVVRLSHRDVTGVDAEFAYSVDVPQNYDPTRKYQLRMQLHGGVDRPTPGARGDGSIGQLAGVEQIYVLPTAWRERPWWGDAQLENLGIILDRVKRTYNVDENRVVLSGVSDGATSTYYVAMRNTTPFASYLPLNGYIMILANPSMRLTDGFYPTNLLNKPFFVVNGGQDPLYPTEVVEPYITHFKKSGVEVDFKPQPDGVHNTAWWPQVKDSFEAFVAAHPRDPLPAKLVWETDGNPRSNRASWLVIDRLRPRGPEVPLTDLNQRVVGTSKNFGIRTAGMRITTVVANSNAAAIGLLPGDIVTNVNGRDLPEALNMMDLMAIYDPGTPLTFKVRRGIQTIDLRGTYQPTDMPAISTMFPRNPPSGRVDLARTGNTVRATTRGVAQVTLLLSPDAFDFSQPITVFADDKQVFSGRVAPSVATLMKWAALDNDRTMLFGAELKVEVP